MTLSHVQQLGLTVSRTATGHNKVRPTSDRCNAASPAAHLFDGCEDLVLLGGVGLEHVLDERLFDAQDLRELALNLQRALQVAQGLGWSRSEGR